MPSNYYGFSPMMKNRGATIAAVGAGIGQTIAQLPGIIREEKKFKYDEAQRQKAIEAIQADSALADDAYKAFKEQYKNRAQPLVEAGLMTQDQVDSNLRTIPMLRESDKLDTKSLNSFIERQGSTIANLYKELTNQERRLQTGQEVKGAVEGRPAGFAPPEVSEEQTAIAAPGGQPMFTEQDITARERTPAVPPAQTREEAAGRIPAGVTSQEAEQVPAYRELPTGLQKEKEKRLSEKESRLTEMTDYQQAKLALQWAKENRLKEHGEIRLQQAEDKAKQSVNKLISTIQNKQIAQIDDQIKELKNPEPDIYGQPGQVDYDKIAELESQKLNLQDQIDQLKAEKKMFGAVRETRRFAPSGRETSRSKISPTPSERPALSGQTGGWKQYGKYKIRQKQ